MTLDSSLQVVFVDALFLCLAAGLALWFRAWLREQQAAMDRRLAALEEQQQALSRVCERLTSACRGLERPFPAAEVFARSARPEPPGEAARVDGAAPTPAVEPRLPTADAPARPPVAIPGLRRRSERVERVDTPAARADRQWEELTDRSREAYRRARDLLEQGVPPNDIARQVGLGVAEVNVLKRMRDAGRR